MPRFRHVFRFFLIAAAAFFGFGHVAFSSAGRGMDAQTLMTFCSGKFDTDFGICSGYISAVAEAMLDGNALYGARACGHDGVKAQQLVDLVRMDFSEDDALRRQSAGEMVAGILARSFPCYDNISPAAGP